MGQRVLVRALRASRDSPSGGYASRLTMRVGFPAGAAMLLLAWAITTVSYTPETLMAAPFLTTGTVLIGCLFWEGHVRGRGFITPLGFATVVYGTMFCLMPLVDLWFGHPITHSHLFASAGWLAASGALLMYLGYRLGRKASFRNRPLTWHSGRARLMAVLFLAVAIGAVLLTFGGVEGVTVLVTEFGARRVHFDNSPATLAGVSLAVPAVVLLVTNWIVRRKHLAFLIVAAPLALAASSYFGQRWRALALIVAVGALLHLGHKRLPILLIGATAFLLVGAFVFAGMQRNIIGTDREPRDISGENFYYDYIGRTHEVGQFRDFILTLEGVPARVPYQGGKTFLSVIPRAPFPTGGYVFSSVFFPDIYSAGTSIPAPLPGELYMNFGLAGIFGGMIVFGAALGLLQSYLETGSTLRALPIYAYSLLPVALILRGSFTTFAGWYLVGLIALWAALRHVTKPHHLIPS